VVTRKHYSRAHEAANRVYDAVGNVIETHEHGGGFKEPQYAKQKAATPVKRDG
jgi:hypothetical protein